MEQVIFGKNDDPWMRSEVDAEALPTRERFAILSAVGLAVVATIASVGLIVSGSLNAATRGKPTISADAAVATTDLSIDKPPAMETRAPGRRGRDDFPSPPEARAAASPPVLLAAADQPPPALNTASVPPPAVEPAPVAPRPETPAPARPVAKEHDSDGPRRIRVRGSDGKTAVARMYGRDGREVHVLLPDGQLGIVDDPAFVPDPFVPATADVVERDLLDGSFSTFKALRTPHYVILYQCSLGFAQRSGEVLERLYKGLFDAFRRFDVAVHDAEFPLVVVIFNTEDDFRAHKKVAPEIQAYYEIYSNRIFFYESSARDERAPEVAALRRPQTVAHEGTHQILANIGIHPRLAPWPAWLTEGLAEYCSTPVLNKKGVPTWTGLGMVNSLHMATLRDLDDPASGQVDGTMRTEHIGRAPGMPLVEYLVTKTDLTPTDYALAWALTHYLARRRPEAFVAYLRAMSALAPLSTRTPKEHLEEFRAAFGKDLGKLDRDIDTYLSKLKSPHPLPYYAVVFQQRVGPLVRRLTMVSQSPSMIQQWVATATAPQGDVPDWQVFSFTHRTAALSAAERWFQNR